MITIELSKIREALPSNATVKIGQVQSENGKVQYIECIVRNPSLSDRFPLEYEKDFEMIKDWQRNIIGEENISEIYTETTGEHWKIYLKRIPMTIVI